MKAEKIVDRESNGQNGRQEENKIRRNKKIRKEGKKEGKKEGRKEGRKEARKEGRKEGYTNEQKIISQ